MNITIQPEKHEKLVPVSARIPEQTAEHFKAFCDRISSSQSHVLTQLLTQFLDAEERKTKGNKRTKKMGAAA